MTNFISTINIYLEFVLKVVGIISFLVVAIAYFSNGIKILIKICKGLAKSKIGICGSGDNYNDLRSLLTDSKLFKKKNIGGSV